jgi:NitT/TauT family transport system permease protein
MRGPGPTAPGRGHRTRWTVIAGLAVATPILGFAGVPVGSVSAHLPLAAYDLSLSFVRMLLAYLLSLGFSLTYGYFASTHRTGERILIPVLDILQSIPILGFFPIVIVLLVSATPNSWVGPNAASIILIFTSMSWNMVFGVYESLKSLPNELREASDSFGVGGWQRIRRVLLPATVNRLVYNSVLSWTGGWYFLVAAEFISTSSSSTVLPGIGSFLLSAAAAGDTAGLVAGLVLLIALIATLDIFVWRPLGRWAEKYRYDQVPSGESDVGMGVHRRAPLRRAAGYVYRGVVTGVTRIGTPLLGLAISATPARLRAQRPMLGRAARSVGLGALLVIVWLLLIAIIVATFGVFTAPISAMVRHQILLLPLALGASFARLLLAYVISLSLALGLAIYVVSRPRAYQLGLPTIEIFASIPATALFPLFIFALLPAIGFQGAAILMLLTGMMWYLFFNILSGLRAIPPDLKEAGVSLGLPRRLYYRRLVLPAIFPALITGSITAFGGGWNTLIIAEYLQYGSTHQFHVLGIGELIDIGNLEPGGYPLMAAALFTMVLAVVAVNELLWKPLYRRAVDRYRYE